MNSIITYLLLYIQYLHKEILRLTLFIAKYIPLKQWAFDDSQSPEYQKFKTNKLPRILKFEKYDYRFLLAYYKHYFSISHTMVANYAKTATVLLSPLCMLMTTNHLTL